MKAVLDAERLRVHAARGLIEAGAAGGRDDVDAVVNLIETRGFVHDGKAATLIFGLHEGKERISHTEQLRIEQSVADMSRAAARDRSADLSDAAIRAAIERVEADDAGVRFSKEQLAAIHALGAGGKLSLLTGVAGSGKTTLLKPLVDAWRDDGRTVIGMSTAWRQADALQEAGADETIALQPLLNAIDTGEFSADENTVLIVDEISQIGPRPMLKLLELQAKTGMTIKMLGDREQVQSIEAGDTIALLKRVLPKSAMPEVLTAVRQKNDRDRKIAALFRDGKAETALAMKREDGTARTSSRATPTRWCGRSPISTSSATMRSNLKTRVMASRSPRSPTPRRPTSAGRSASVSKPAARSGQTRRRTRRSSIAPRSQNSSTCPSRPEIGCACTAKPPPRSTASAPRSATTATSSR